MIEALSFSERARKTHIFKDISAHLDASPPPLFPSDLKRSSRFGAITVPALCSNRRCVCIGDPELNRKVAKSGTSTACRLCRVLVHATCFQKKNFAVGGIRGSEELRNLVVPGGSEGPAWKVAFCMYPVCVTEVMNVADAEMLMPPKVRMYFAASWCLGLGVRLIDWLMG